MCCQTEKYQSHAASVFRCIDALMHKNVWVIVRPVVLLLPPCVKEQVLHLLYAAHTPVSVLPRSPENPCLHYTFLTDLFQGDTTTRYHALLAFPWNRKAL